MRVCGIMTYTCAMRTGTQIQRLPAKYGDYILLQRIARGGMADVFRARSLAPGTAGKGDVAVKCIRPELAEDASMIEMMVDEARIAGSLDHRNIASVYDSGRVGESFFIAMEFVHGIDLATIVKHLQRKNLLIPMPHAMRIMSDVCGALYAAHSQKDADGRPLHIVHRDVSPHNILIGFHGDVKLIDFGVARASRRTTKTAVGMIKGKLTYMAPEQAMGRPIDGRADIFSIGVSLFRILTGSLPFNGRSDLDVFRALTTQDAPLARSVNPRIPRAVEQLIVRCLKRNPAERFSSAADVRAALIAIISQEWGNYNPASLANYMRTAFGRLMKPKASPPPPPIPGAATPSRQHSPIQSTHELLERFAKEENAVDEWDELSNDPTTVMPVEVVRANAMAAMGRLPTAVDDDDDFYLATEIEFAPTMVTPSPFRIGAASIDAQAQRPPSPRRARPPTTPRAVRRPSAAPITGELVDELTPRARPLPPPPLRATHRRGNWLLFGLAALIVVGALAVLLVDQLTDDPIRSVQPPSHTETAAGVAPASPAASPQTAINQARLWRDSALLSGLTAARTAVVITIESDPAGVALIWRGHPQGVTPARLVMPRSTRAEDVVLRSTDGAERTLLVVPDSNQTQRVSLR